MQRSAEFCRGRVSVIRHHAWAFSPDTINREVCILAEAASREASVPTAAEVIAAAETALVRAQGYPSYYRSIHVDAYGDGELMWRAVQAVTEAEEFMRDALAAIAKWKGGPA